MRSKLPADGDLSYLFNKPKNAGERFADVYGEEGVGQLVNRFNELMEGKGGFIIIGTEHAIIDAYLGVSEKELLRITRRMIKKAKHDKLLTEDKNGRAVN